MSDAYLHGYDRDEQRRLVDQAEYWRDRIILPGLGYQAGERVLDIGCGVGAVLGVLHAGFSGLRLAGIDREPRQIEFARTHLASLGASDADLRVGDATRLPWADGTFDRVITMWFLEHVKDPVPILREAGRVLRPGGTITCIETDYAIFKVWPLSKDWDAIERAQCEHFARHGDAAAGRRLGWLLKQANFERLENQAVAFHLASAIDRKRLRAHVEYIAGFLEPAIPSLAPLARELGLGDEVTLQRGCEHLKAIWRRDDGATTHVVHRASGVNVT